MWTSPKNSRTSDPPEIHATLRAVILERRSVPSTIVPAIATVMPSQAGRGQSMWVGILQETAAKNAIIGAKHQKKYLSTGRDDRAVLQTAIAASGNVNGTTPPHCIPRNFRKP